MESKIKLIKCQMYPSSGRKKNPNKIIPSLLCATDYPVFDVKAYFNDLVPSDVINRPKSADLNIKRSLLLVLSVS